jgi:hypothetical protein
MRELDEAVARVRLERRLRQQHAPLTTRFDE